MTIDVTEWYSTQALCFLIWLRVPWFYDVFIARDVFQTYFITWELSKFILHCRVCLWFNSNLQDQWYSRLLCIILQAVEDEEVRAALLKEVKKQEVRLSKDCFSEGHWLLNAKYKFTSHFWKTVSLRMDASLITPSTRSWEKGLITDLVTLLLLLFQVYRWFNFWISFLLFDSYSR